MQGANVIFILDGVELPIQCNRNDVMKDICQKYSNKVERNINTLVFLYGGSQLNFNLKFKEVITNKDSNEMKVLVYSNETDEFICPKCGEKIKLNTEKIDDIILSINNLKETIDSAKFMLENVIKISTVNNVNVQLKGINIIIDSLIEGVKKTKEKVKNLLNENKNIENKNIENKNIENKNNENNYITAEIIIKEDNINKNVRILNSYEECLRIEKYFWVRNEKYKNEAEIRKCEIKINDTLIPFNYSYKFKSKGIYTIKYSFQNKLKNTCFMFYECSSLTKINLSNFNSDNVIDMAYMFYECSSLTNINLSNFNTNNVTNMEGMFWECSSLTNINLSNFNTSNVTDMGYMFYECLSLTDINLSNFNTSKVTNMEGMFYECSSLTNIDLSNFNTNNVSKINGMFGRCESLNKNNIIIKDRKMLNYEGLFEE